MHLRQLHETFSKQLTLTTSAGTICIVFSMVYVTSEIA
jgi:hypothetical protein